MAAQLLNNSLCIILRTKRSWVLEFKRSHTFKLMVKFQTVTRANLTNRTWICLKVQWAIAVLGNTMFKKDLTKANFLKNKATITSWQRTNAEKPRIVAGLSKSLPELQSLSTCIRLKPHTVKDHIWNNLLSASPNLFAPAWAAPAPKMATTLITTWLLEMKHTIELKAVHNYGPLHKNRHSHKKRLKKRPTCHQYCLECKVRVPMGTILW